MPPLRDRREDIPLLARHFAAKHGKRAKRRVAGLSPETLSCLENYDWPGNVRELENAVERAVVLGSTELIVPEDLPEAILEAAPPASQPGGDYHQAVRERKRAPSSPPSLSPAATTRKPRNCWAYIPTTCTA